tara:strand:+ start:549 stop:956 length:408 start_codon:yes stop_codon:yes gene_type:complete
MIQGAYYPSENPTGTITAKQYQNDLTKTYTKYLKDHHKNYYRNTDGVEDYDKRLIQLSSLSANLNNLLTFNPTSKLLNKYKEHSTNEHLLNGKSHVNTRYMVLKNTHIASEIERLRKPGNHKVTQHKHSHSLELL